MCGVPGEGGYGWRGIDGEYCTYYLDTGTAFANQEDLSRTCVAIIICTQYNHTALTLKGRNRLILGKVVPWALIFTCNSFGFPISHSIDYIGTCCVTPSSNFVVKCRL
jgi:hypothetical protein